MKRIGPKSRSVASAICGSCASLPTDSKQTGQRYEPQSSGSARSSSPRGNALQRFDRRSGLAPLRAGVASFLAALPSSPSAQSAWRVGDGPTSEALTIPASVNYVGKGANLYRLGLRPSGAALVVVKYLRTTWLWEKVRVQGGAYGGFCVLDHRSGNFTFLSYRDPNLLETLDIYDQTPAI